MVNQRVGGISIVTSSDFHLLDDFLATIEGDTIFEQLDGFANEGVQALAAATPEETGRAASSWSYEIVRPAGVTGTAGNTWEINWTNSDIDDQGTPIVILLRYGHGTYEGGYVAGRDFITPAMEPLFDQIANNVWEAVQSA